ncbi:Protein of uncharacterised function (DUF3237) [Klebsiella michiganensis]|uniref:Protein of uncharacterized function (DUF3237) n=1 Tax=Klebsiella michiganensis TaxID=1134687 RepID=A0A7H4PF71_9ENTR|nr:Protein of uncharacterised function (DUF3237) [Klebsiella michiganensis]
MTPELEHSFSITIQVDKPIIVSRSPQSGKRQLIPILSGTVRGELNGHVLPGGVDSQIVEPDGTAASPPAMHYMWKKARYTSKTTAFAAYPKSTKSVFFGDDMRFFSDIPPEAIYFRTVPTFEVDAPALRWLTTSLFICSGGRTQDGVMLDFYRVR